MYCKKMLLRLLFCGVMTTVSGQTVLKLGNSPYLINDKAAFEVESVTKGILPPRMTKVQRDAIDSPPVGLLVWCSDSNTATEPVSGELCVYMGTGWAPFTLLTTSKLSTGKKSDTNKPVRVSATSATINGVLSNSPGALPTEIGIVWREIIGTDFSTMPFLDGTAAATAPTYKTIGTLVTTDGSPIAVTIPSLTSTASSARPYYFRTYAKTPLGIGYGNPIIFNCAPPVISTPVITNGTTLYPTFAGTLTVNAGTPAGTITEYGYCSGTTTNPTTANDKVVLSTTLSLNSLNATLNSEIFVVDPTIDLAVSNYDTKVIGTTYFRYYVTTSYGTTFYSPQVTFSPVADAVTGGSAIATVSSVDPISTALKFAAVSSSTIKVNFTVTKPGTYASFGGGAASGATTGLSIATVAAGSFSLGAQSLIFSVSGTPATAIDGNTFAVPRIAIPLSTGNILKGDISGGNAICNGLYETTVVPITSSTTKVWMDRNLGASRAATSLTDFQAYGCLYQWGRGNDGHASITWTSGTAGTAVNSTTATLADSPANALFITNNTSPQDWRVTQSNTLWQGLLGTNNPCPAAYRLPTNAEISSETTAYAITNTALAYSSIHKFVTAGVRSNVTGAIAGAGTSSGIMSSTVSGAFASFRNTDSSISGVSNGYRASAYSVRCIKD